MSVSMSSLAEAKSIIFVENANDGFYVNPYNKKLPTSVFGLRFFLNPANNQFRNNNLRS